MKTALDVPKNAASLVQEINALKKEQLDLEVFLREVARANDGALDYYFQTDDLKYRENDKEWNEHYLRLEVSYILFRQIGAIRISPSALIWIWPTVLLCHFVQRLTDVTPALFCFISSSRRQLYFGP